MRIVAKCLAIVTVLLLPRPLLAQAILTGTVHDPSGAVLPGVTVEAASPALIERVRTAVTSDRPLAASTTATPVITSCARPRSRRSIARAAS